MLCQNCNKESATTFIKKTINGITKEYCLCKNCAAKLGINSYNFFDSDNIFLTLLSNDKFDKPENKCKLCNSTYEDIVDKGRLGCAECYNTFYDELIPSIIKIQGKSVHKGLKPEKFNSTKSEIKDLENDLKMAIEKEEYEKAAEIRDVLKAKRGEGYE